MKIMILFDINAVIGKGPQCTAPTPQKLIDYYVQKRRPIDIIQKVVWLKSSKIPMRKSEYLSKLISFDP